MKHGAAVGSAASATFGTSGSSGTEPTLAQLVQDEEQLLAAAARAQAGRGESGSLQTPYWTAPAMVNVNGHDGLSVEWMAQARRSSVSLGEDTFGNGYHAADQSQKDDWDAAWAEHRQDRDRFVPESAILHPPLYGRPGPSPSPDIFA